MDRRNKATAFIKCLFFCSQSFLTPLTRAKEKHLPELGALLRCLKMVEMILGLITSHNDRTETFIPRQVGFWWVGCLTVAVLLFAVLLSLKRAVEK